VNKSLASKVVRTPDRVASKVVRTPDRVASKVAAADSRSRASKVVRTLDRVASKVAADSRSRASSLDSVNFSSTRILSRLRAGIFLFRFLTQAQNTSCGRRLLDFVS
jgi:hypothetical protein